MNKYFVLFLMMSSVTTFSCHPTKTNPESFSGKQIIFGSGGGFSGAYLEYVLQESGDLYKKEDIKQDYSWVKRMDETETKQIFSNYTSLGIDKMKLNNPGNMYYFIGLNSEDEQHKLVWSDQTKIEQNLQLFYRILLHHIQA